MKKNLLVLFIIIISLFSCSKDTIKEKTNFNLPSLGKFNTNFKKIQRVKKQKQIINEKTKNKERQTFT